MPDPTPDAFGRYRVAETVGGKTRHYSTKRYMPGAHTIVPGPASYENGDELPMKRNVAEQPPASPKGA